MKLEVIKGLKDSGRIWVEDLGLEVMVRDWSIWNGNFRDVGYDLMSGWGGIGKNSLKKPKNWEIRVLNGIDCLVTSFYYWFLEHQVPSVYEAFRALWVITSKVYYSIILLLDGMGNLWALE